MKVYVITKGSYSDYSIRGVAIDKELAEKIRKQVSDRFEEANIEVYDTDKYMPLAEGKKPYSVGIDEKNGSCIALYEREYDIEECNGKVIRKTYGSDAWYGIDLWAKDKEHALKIARDKIAEYKYRKEIDEQ